jgi:hypothetical protein
MGRCLRPHDPAAEGGRKDEPMKPSASLLATIVATSLAVVTLALLFVYTPYHCGRLPRVHRLTDRGEMLTEGNGRYIWRRIYDRGVPARPTAASANQSTQGIAESSREARCPALSA